MLPRGRWPHGGGLPRQSHGGSSRRRGPRARCRLATRAGRRLDAGTRGHRKLSVPFHGPARPLPTRTRVAEYARTEAAGRVHARASWAPCQGATDEHSYSISSSVSPTRHASIVRPLPGPVGSRPLNTRTRRRLPIRGRGRRRQQGGGSAHIGTHAHSSHPSELRRTVTVLSYSAH